MRLIDADKVKQHALTVGFYCDTDADKKATAEKIDQLFPTVEAIPVEWLEARIDRLNKELREAKRHGQGQLIKWREWELFGLKDMLKDWREENAID